jgi:type II secretory pathway component PulC
MRLKKIIKNINILNILLLTVILFFAGYNIAPLLEAKITYTPPPAKKHLNVLEEKEDETPLSNLPSVLEYALIGENNLFHPERKIPVEKKVEQPLPKPDFVLYGTLITNDISLAYLEDRKAPRSTPGRGKRQTALRKGDTMEGFTLKDIEHEKIVMVRGEEKITVPIMDPSHPRERKETSVTTASPSASAPTQERPAAVSRQQTRQQRQSSNQPIKSAR